MGSVPDAPRVSPYGFGPYPELPPPWPRNYWDGDISKNHELIGRVRIKMYGEGISVDGMHMDDATGMIHAIIPNTVYVEWSSAKNAEGAYERYVTAAVGHPDAMKRWKDLQFPNGMDAGPPEILFESQIPTDIDVLSYDEDGIDPYEFLGLDKE